MKIKVNDLNSSHLGSVVKLTQDNFFIVGVLGHLQFHIIPNVSMRDPDTGALYWKDMYTASLGFIGLDEIDVVWDTEIEVKEERADD